MQITQTIKDSVFVLIEATKHSNDLETLQQYFADNMDTLPKALQLIGVTDSEPLIEIAHQTLWQVCPEELEGHVNNCAGAYIQLIAMAWQQHDGDLTAAVKQWFEVTDFTPKKNKMGMMGAKGTLPAEPNPNDVEHLNKCLSI
jgi:hypothetical protein